MGVSVSSMCSGPSCCLQLFEVVAADLPWGFAQHPALLRGGDMVTPGHKQSPRNAVCSLELSHRNKGCDCTVFICHLRVSRVLCLPGGASVGM